MREDLTDLQELQRLVVNDRLAEARARAAFMVFRPTPDLVSSIDDARVRSATQALADAPDVGNAARLVATVATACANCHRRLDVRPFRAVPPEPDARNDASGVARHQWAAARLLEGLAISSDTQWQRGLEALASIPMIDGASTASLRSNVRDALTLMPRDREGVFSHILESCITCHAQLRSR